MVRSLHSVQTKVETVTEKNTLRINAFLGRLIFSHLFFGVFDDITFSTNHLHKFHLVLYYLFSCNLLFDVLQVTVELQIMNFDTCIYASAIPYSFCLQNYDKIMLERDFSQNLT